MADGAFVAPVNLTESAGYFRDVTGQEVPVQPGGSPAAGVFGKDGGRVVLGVHGYGEKGDIAGPQMPGYRGEAGGEAGADVRQRAARVDEVDGEDPAFEIGEPEGF